jgi:V/A-type H+-transporting ATPase subunit A
MAEREGIVYRINGPVIEANQITGIFMGDMVEVGEERLIGETIGLDEDKAIIQVYEDTGGLRPGIKVYGTGLPLAAELGPGLLTNTYDGIQRPLRDIQDQVGNFITRGVQVPSLNREKKWLFQPKLKIGDKVKANSILGTVQETALIEHRILVPPDVDGEITFIIGEGDYTIEKVLARVKTATGEKELQMFHRWPVRQKRASLARLNPSAPLNPTYKN